jgi:hypothetical protein
MFIMTCILAILSPAVDCSPEDHECNGRQYERLAAAATVPQHRANQLYGAHRAYVARFDETGKVEHLCAARRTFDRGIAIKGQTTGQRAAFAALRSALVKREQESGAQCRKPTRRPREAAPAEAPRPGSTQGDASALAGMPGSTLAPPAPKEIAETPPAEPKHSDTRDNPPPVRPTMAVSVPPAHTRDDAARRRVRAGLATLVPGLVLLAPTAGVLAFRAGVQSDWDELRRDTQGRSPTPNEDSAGAALNSRHRGATAAAVVLGVTSAALVVTGTVLLATRRHSSRVAFGPWGSRGVGGLVIGGRF